MDRLRELMHRDDVRDSYEGEVADGDVSSEEGWNLGSSLATGPSTDCASNGTQPNMLKLIVSA